MCVGIFLLGNTSLELNSDGFQKTLFGFEFPFQKNIQLLYLSSDHYGQLLCVVIIDVY